MMLRLEWTAHSTQWAAHVKPHCTCGVLSTCLATHRLHAYQTVLNLFNVQQILETSSFFLAVVLMASNVSYCPCPSESSHPSVFCNIPWVSIWRARFAFRTKGRCGIRTRPVVTPHVAFAQSVCLRPSSCKHCPDVVPVFVEVVASCCAQQRPPFSATSFISRHQSAFHMASPSIGIRSKLPAQTEPLLQVLTTPTLSYMNCCKYSSSHHEERLHTEHAACFSLDPFV